MNTRWLARVMLNGGLKLVFGMGTLLMVFICTPVSRTIAPHWLSSRSIIAPYSAGETVPGS